MELLAKFSNNTLYIYNKDFYGQPRNNNKIK